MLMPAAVLVMVILGAIVVDSAVLRVRAHELDNAATAAANDAAAYLLDARLYESGVIEASESDAREIAAESLRARGLEGLELADVAILDDRVVVRVRREVEVVFGRALLGDAASRTLSGEGRASLLVDTP